MPLLDSFRDWVNQRSGQAQPIPPGPNVAAPVAIRPRRFKWIIPLAIGFVAAVYLFTLPKGEFHPPVAYQGITPTDERQLARLHPSSQRAASLQQQEAEARLRAQDDLLRSQMSSGMPPGMMAQPSSATADPAQQERERMRKSLFASPIISVPEESVAAGVAPTAASAPLAPPPVVSTATKPSDAHRRDCLDTVTEGEQLYAVCEGTFVDLVLNNRLVGDYAGPVVATLSDDIYSRDRGHLLLPKGTRILGRADRTSDAYQQRMVVRFHRILFDTGRGYALKETPGLNQAGDSALKADKINRHLLSTFSTSIALAALGGLSAVGTGGYLNASGADMYRQGVTQNLGQQAQQIANQNLNQRRPTLEVLEGHPIKLMLEEDLLLPEYEK